MVPPAEYPAGLRLPAGLTGPQLEAITAADRALCVLAGAGAGKTRVLTLRVARRIRDGSADPAHVLVTTFSRKAAEDLRRRLWLLGVSDGVRGATFHRTALSLIRQHRADRGLAAVEVVGDRRPLLRQVLAEGGLSGGRPPGAVRGPPGGTGPHAERLDTEIGWAKARLTSPQDYEQQARRHGRRTPLSWAGVAEVYARYEDRRRRQRLLDLDDLLWAAGELLEEDHGFADAVRWRFRHLFVDEMQDVNPAQFRLLSCLMGPTPDIFVVGDPNQSVYGWNGADPGLLDRMTELVPGTRVLRLDENHRCSPQIVSVAAAALGLSGDGAPGSARPDGAVPAVVAHATDVEEAEWVARQVWLAHRPGRRWAQMAVLARTNAQLAVVASAFDRARVPYRHAGSDLGPASDLRPVSGPPPEDDGRGPDGAARSGLGDGPGDAVVLSSFHRAKGLQWSAVFVIGLADGVVPLASATTAAARSEERRLLYVALTRAEDELWCSWAGGRDARGTGATGGGAPCPWLPAVEEASRRLASAAAVPGPGDVAAHLAALRAQLSAPGATTG